MKVTNIILISLFGFIPHYLPTIICYVNKHAEIRLSNCINWTVYPDLIFGSHFFGSHGWRMNGCGVGTQQCPSTTGYTSVPVGRIIEKKNRISLHHKQEKKCPPSKFKEILSYRNRMGHPRLKVRIHKEKTASQKRMFPCWMWKSKVYLKVSNWD